MAQTTTIWLSRHGEVHNPRELLYGRLPRMNLSPEGIRQAEELAKFLAARPLAGVYSSPMLRARKTAERIRLRHPGLDRIRIDSDLTEIRSAWQGEPLTALESIGWDFYAHPKGQDDESLQMIHDRMLRWLQRMLRRHAGFKQSMDHRCNHRGPGAAEHAGGGKHLDPNNILRGNEAAPGGGRCGLAGEIREATIQHQLYPGLAGLKIIRGVWVFNHDDPGRGVGDMAGGRPGGLTGQTGQPHGCRDRQPADRLNELCVRVS